MIVNQTSIPKKHFFSLATPGTAFRGRNRLNRSWRVRSQWLENSAQSEVDVPIDVAWELWEDRTQIPKWMPWITRVEIQEEDPRLSKWTLSTYQFNRQVLGFICVVNLFDSRVPLFI